MASYKQNNFYARWQEKPRAAKQSSGKWRAALPGLGVVLVAAAALGVVLFNNAALQRELDETQAWVEHPDNINAYSESIVKQAHNRLLLSQAQAVQNTWDALASYPIVDTAITRRIETAGGDNISVALRSYNATTGILTFDAKSIDVIDIPAYVRRLESTGLFHSVTYTGYGFENNSQLYTINVSCVMEAADKEG